MSSAHLKLRIRVENCSLIGELSGNDVYSLLKKEEMLTGDILNCYRCLLMKRDCDRTKLVCKGTWLPSWIYNTVFITRMLQEGKVSCGYNYQEVSAEGGKVYGG